MIQKQTAKGKCKFNLCAYVILSVITSRISNNFLRYRTPKITSKSGREQPSAA